MRAATAGAKPSESIVWPASTSVGLLGLDQRLEGRAARRGARSSRWVPSTVSTSSTPSAASSPAKRCGSSPITATATRPPAPSGPREPHSPARARPLAAHPVAPRRAPARRLIRSSAPARSRRSGRAISAGEPSSISAPAPRSGVCQPTGARPGGAASLCSVRARGPRAHRSSSGLSRACLIARSVA